MIDRKTLSRKDPEDPVADLYAKYCLEEPSPEEEEEKKSLETDAARYFVDEEGDEEDGYIAICEGAAAWADAARLRGFRAGYSVALALMR